ncbi:GNAT family N-acetyltransferase [Sphingobium sp. Ndbn-10]|uniref:GNAT family N-acetyltransferase n=1 Tax=Sphingobium sp. Ndbn-10 TaxID=1667223 RepID=UPI00081899B4|nr:GNAT family N-acetyltransferase [Sphingobium sp. Ndbn-10]
MSHRIEITDNPAPADVSGLLDGLRAYNLSAGGISIEPLAVWLRSDAGDMIGGLTGRTGAGWLFIEFFWLPEEMRGQGFGSELIRRAEETAIGRGCIGAWLDTFSFQAPGFYERHGYESFGVIEDYPAGSRRHFMQKRFDRPAG